MITRGDFFSFAGNPAEVGDATGVGDSEATGAAGAAASGCAGVKVNLLVSPEAGWYTRNAASANKATLEAIIRFIL